mmetsp:Transcript_10352/g.14916  ORF Transcript_10352/g.14916 Transcript_10352/m.14916 type:complete len:90 (-) Transcript_10352:51-320(-)
MRELRHQDFYNNWILNQHLDSYLESAYAFEDSGKSRPDTSVLKRWYFYNLDNPPGSHSNSHMLTDLKLGMLSAQKLGQTLQLGQVLKEE